MSFMIGKIEKKKRIVLDNAQKKERECQVDIVDGDNATEIAGQREKRDYTKPTNY